MGEGFGDGTTAAGDGDGASDVDGLGDGDGDGDATVTWLAVGEIFRADTGEERSATIGELGDGDGTGYAATRANPPPHEPKKTIAVAIAAAVITPRRRAIR